MTQRIDVRVFLETKVNQNREVKIQMSIFNGSPNDYWINGNVVLIGGFQYKCFNIYGGPSIIPCSFHTGSYNIVDHFILVSSNETTLGSELSLSKVCSFKDAKPGTYILKIDVSSMLYTSEQYHLHINNYTPMGPIEYFIERLESTIILGESEESMNGIDNI